MLIAQHKWLFYLLIVLSTASNFVFAQQEKYLAIIPTFHDRLNTSGIESSLRLQSQQLFLFVYRNAVVIYSEANFINTGMDTLSQEFALPSTGYDENGDEPGGRLSNGILSVQLSMEGERIAPYITNDGNEDWYTIRTEFAPGEQREVRAVFWAQTSLTDVDSLPGLDTIDIPVGKRGFMIDLSHSAVWNNVIESIDVTVILKGGMSVQRDSFTFEPSAYDLQDSIITWSLKSVEPSPSDNIVVSYTPFRSWRSATNTMAKLSRYIVKKVYDKLQYYVEQMEQK